MRARREKPWRIFSVRRPRCNPCPKLLLGRCDCGSTRSEIRRCWNPGAGTIPQVPGLPTVRDDLRVLQGYHSPQLNVEVRLNTNESPLPPPEGFLESFQSRIDQLSWNRYPDREARRLREALADFEGVEPNCVFVANGSNEVIQTLCLAYGGYGRTAVTFEPTYAMHGQIARTVQCTTVELDRSANFDVDVDVLDRAFAEHQPSILFLCSPNNPTGTAEKLSTIERAVRGADSDCLIIVDEAYGQFASFSASELLADDVGLVVTRTFSKTWSMAGARLGYLLGPPSLVEELYKVVLPYHLDSVKQAAGELALQFVDEMEVRVGAIKTERKRLSDGLDALGFEVFESQANFILFRTTPAGWRGDELWRALVEQSVLVRNCSSWPRLHDCLRVTVGSSGENDRFLDAIVMANTLRDKANKAGAQ